MKFLLIAIFLVLVFGKNTKMEADLDAISEYSSMVSGKIMSEYGGRGKFVVFTAKHHFIADNEDLADQLCDLLPLPCIVDLIANDTFFMGSGSQETSILLSSVLNEKQFMEKLEKSWVPEKSFLVTTLMDFLLQFDF